MIILATLVVITSLAALLVGIILPIIKICKGD